MIITPGKSKTVNVYGTFSEKATGSIVLTKKGGQVVTLNSVRVRSTFAEFFIPESHLTASDLPATAQLKVGEQVYRIIALEVDPKAAAPAMDSEELDAEFAKDIDVNTVQADLLKLQRLEAKTALEFRRLGARAVRRAEVAKGTMIKENWNNLTDNGWIAAATAPTVAGNRLTAGGASKIVSIAPGERFLVRVEVTINSTAAARASYLAISNAAGALPATDNNGAYIGIGGTSNPTLAFFKGSAVTSSPTMGSTAVGTGTFLFTIAGDEEVINFSIQKRGTNPQAIYSSSIPRTAMPGGTGAINQIVVNTIATSTAEHSFGPLFFWKEIQPPFTEDRTIGGINLFGTGNPLALYRLNPSNNIRQAYKVPGDYDPRVPTPVVQFFHQANTGAATNPYTESRWADPVVKLETAGYALISSDNGISSFKDNVGNQLSLDDYTHAFQWFTERFNTECRFIVSASMGGYPMNSILNRRLVGGIHGVIGLSAGYDLTGIDGSDPALQTVAFNAYGASTTEQYNAAITNYNPKNYPAHTLRGVPFRLYYATNDTITVPAVHHEPLVAKLNALGASEVEVVNKGAVGHMGSVMYNGDEWIAFMNKHRVA